LDAARAERARSRRDDLDAFRTVPVDDVQSNDASAADCVERAGAGAMTGVVLVGHPELAGMDSPEGCRHYSWAFNVAAQPVQHDERERRDNSDPANVGNFPDGAIVARHEHVVVKTHYPRMVERNPGVVRIAA
jgi:hypothetical protein